MFNPDVLLVFDRHDTDVLRVFIVLTLPPEYFNMRPVRTKRSFCVLQEIARARPFNIKCVDIPGKQHFQ